MGHVVETVQPAVRIAPGSKLKEDLYHVASDVIRDMEADPMTGLASVTNELATAQACGEAATGAQVRTPRQSNYILLN
jgi:hypothetical protein